MKKIIYLTIIGFTLCFQNISAQEHKNIPLKTIQSGFGQIDYLSIKMPINDPIFPEANMDFTGIHYNLMLNNWSYFGAGIYGAVGGIRGGFFTLGVNAGIKQNICKNLFIDTGIHFGGGGGASAPDGGGAFILPHLNLGYDFKHFSATAGWSYVNFFDDGAIKSNQFNIAFQIPLSFEYSSFKNREQQFTFNDLTASKWNKPTNKYSVLIHQNNLSVKGDSQFTGGTNINGRTIRTAGFEFNSYFNKNWFYFIKLDGAFKGIPAGYMDVFLGGGYHFSFNKNRTNIITKFGLGAGGGGGVDTKGGFLILPDISLEQKIFDNFYIAINKGYLMSPDSHFLSSTLGFAIKYYVDKDGTTSEEKVFTKAKFKGLQVVLKQDIYSNAKRVSGIEQNLYQISLQFNYFLNKNIYGAGQTSFANFGDAGAYAEGLVGLGVETNPFFNNKVTAFTQVLGGAAGGGGISTGEGLLLKPSAGINISAFENVKLRGAFGIAKARGNGLSNPFINFGITYDFSFLNVK